MCVCIIVFLCKDVGICIYMCVYVFMHACVHVCVYVCMCVCMCMLCTYICVCNVYDAFMYGQIDTWIDAS